MKLLISCLALLIASTNLSLAMDVNKEEKGVDLFSSLPAVLINKIGNELHQQKDYMSLSSVSKKFRTKLSKVETIVDEAVHRVEKNEPEGIDFQKYIYKKLLLSAAPQGGYYEDLYLKIVSSYRKASTQESPEKNKK